MRRTVCCLVVLLAAPALAADRPACLPSGSVLTNPEDAMGGWLLKSGADEVRRHLTKVVGGGTWEGDTLMMSCKIGGGAPIRMKVVTVGISGEGVPEAGDARALAALAARTGHTRQEADVLARRYGALSRAFYRAVRDQDGSQLSERELILRKHERRVAGVDPEADDGAGEIDEAAAQALEKRIEEAQERGDMKEVLRLAGQAQNAAAPATARARRDGKKVEQQRWEVLERAHSELADAAYRTTLVFGQCPCMQCDLPEPPSR